MVHAIRSTHVIWATGHVDPPEAVGERAPETTPPRRGRSRVVCTETPPSRRVVCTETAADALRAYVQRKLEMSTFYAVLGVRPHTVCNRNLDIRTGQGDLGS